MINIIRVKHLLRHDKWNLIWDNGEDFGVIDISKESAYILIEMNKFEKYTIDQTDFWGFSHAG